MCCKNIFSIYKIDIDNFVQWKRLQQENLIQNGQIGKFKNLMWISKGQQL